MSEEEESETSNWGGESQILETRKLATFWTGKQEIAKMSELCCFFYYKCLFVSSDVFVCLFFFVLLMLGFKELFSYKPILNFFHLILCIAQRKVCILFYFFYPNIFTCLTLSFTASG